MPTTPPRTRPTRQSVGRFGEDLAARYLSEHGYEILDRNWRCARGEVDIVARTGGELVVVEVKTRRSLAVGDPVEAVNWRKLARLRQLAATWLHDHPDLHVDGVRIDVVGVLIGTDSPSRVRHLQGVWG